MHCAVTVISPKLLADVGLAHSPDLPPTIQVFKSLARESALCLVSEDQFTINQ
jgi:hypothetical protein